MKILLPLILLFLSSANLAGTITFSEGLVSNTSGSSHNLTNQYDSQYGVTFFNSTCDNNWSLSSDSGSVNPAFASSLDGYHARSTCSWGDIGFREAVDFVEIDFMLDSFFGLDEEIITFELLDTDGIVITTKTTTVYSYQAYTLYTGRFEAPGLIQHLRVSRGADCCWDTLRFGPDIPPLSSSVPEPGALGLLSLGLLGLAVTRRKQAH